MSKPSIAISIAIKIFVILSFFYMIMRPVLNEDIDGETTIRVKTELHEYRGPSLDEVAHALGDHNACEEIERR